MEKKLSTIKFFLVATLMLSCIILQNNIRNVFIAVSIFCFIFGIINLIEKKKYWILLEIVGLDALISMILYYKKVLTFANSLTFYFSFFMLCTMIACMVYVIVAITSKKKEYTKEVEAEVIDYENAPNTKLKYVKPLYKYIVDDQDYYLLAPQYISKRIPKIGTTKIIHIKEDNPEDIYYPPNRSRVISTFISCIVIITACIIIIVHIL